MPLHRPETQAQPDARGQLVDGERAQQVVVAVAAQLGEQAGAALARRHRDDRHVRRLGLHGREHGGLVRPGKLDVEDEQRGIAGTHGVQHRDPVADRVDRHALRPERAQH